MIKELSIKNFRSIREASLELGRFTILNGANNSGKSSVLYALQVLKNVVTNPNRSVDELLNLGYLNLGGLEETTYGRDIKKEITLRVIASKKYETEKIHSGYTLKISSTSNSLSTDASVGGFTYSIYLPVSFPYTLNKNRIVKEKISWNGLQPFVEKTQQSVLSKSQKLIVAALQVPVLELTRLEIIPTHRGFTKPIFNQTPLNGTIYTEEEVATHLAIDKTLQAKVSHYFEKITGKRFSVSMGPGGGFFYLQVREPDTPFTTELVNQGMGINQILFLLAKILYDKNSLIGIDEPEIHLHPTLIERFVKVLVEIALKEKKQFIFSTHSEHWLMSMLAEVNDGNLKAEDLKVYFLQKDGAETTVENQKVFENGQLEGGLRNFLEAEMRLTQRFLD